MHRKLVLVDGRAGRVKVAQSAQPVPKVDVEAERKREAELEQALLKLRAWYAEWSEIARASIKRRDHLIALGLARRKSGDKTPTRAPKSPRARLTDALGACRTPPKPCRAKDRLVGRG